MDPSILVSIGALVISVASLRLMRRESELSIHREVVDLQSSLIRSGQQLRSDVAGQLLWASKNLREIEQSARNLSPPDEPPGDLSGDPKWIEEGVDKVRELTDSYEAHLKATDKALVRILARVEKLEPRKSTSMSQLMSLREAESELNDLLDDNLRNKQALNPV